MQNKQELNKIELLFGSPVANWVTFALVILIGIYGSMYGDIMRKETFNFQNEIIRNGWLLLGITIFLGLVHTQCSNSIQNKRQAKLLSKTEEIYSLYRTMPAEGFLAEFSAIYKFCHETRNDLFSNTAYIEDDSAFAIRAILSGIISLTVAYEKHQKGARYGANLMLFLPTPNLNIDELRRLEGIMKFLSSGFNLARLKGALVLLPMMSISSDQNDFNATDDKLAASFALPVPNTEKDNVVDKYIALPGAPLAFLTNYTNQYGDISSLCSWMENEGDFRDATVLQVRRYFTSPEAAEVKSFLSHPLSNNQGSIGVLNIHKNRIGLLNDQEQRNQFTHVMSPIFEILSEVLSAHLQRFPFSI